MTERKKATPTAKKSDVKKSAAQKSAAKKPGVSKTAATKAGKKPAADTASGARRAAPALIIAKVPEPGGRILSKDPILLPRQPGHHFGRNTLVSALAPCDIIYTGSQHRLDILEVLRVMPLKTDPEKTLLIEVAAISLTIDGKEYTSRERITLQAERSTQVAIGSATTF